MNLTTMPCLRSRHDGCRNRCLILWVTDFRVTEETRQEDGDEHRSSESDQAIRFHESPLCHDIARLVRASVWGENIGLAFPYPPTRFHLKYVTPTFVESAPSVTASAASGAFASPARDRPAREEIQRNPIP